MGREAEGRERGEVVRSGVALVARPGVGGMAGGQELHQAVPHRFRDHRRRGDRVRSEEHTSELQSQSNLVCRLLLEKKKRLLFVRTTDHARTLAKPVLVDNIPGLLRDENGAIDVLAVVFEPAITLSGVSPDSGHMVV